MRKIFFQPEAILILTAFCLIPFIAGCSTTPSSSVEFTRKAEVFGVTILASEKVSDRILEHTASVMAEYLDNNEDGYADNQAVADRMKANKATLFLFYTQDESENFDFNSIDTVFGQDLYEEETHPGGAAKGVFDASLEEVLHLITHSGYAQVYPPVFGEYKGSETADAMDKARGGYFREVPVKYPDSAWFTYYDKTCDYSSMITEYIYWALTSILGAQNFSGRFDEIKEEWKLNTGEKVQSADSDIYAILTNPAYKLPTVLPDGNYNGGTGVIKISAY